MGRFGEWEALGFGLGLLFWSNGLIISGLSRGRLEFFASVFSSRIIGLHSRLLSLSALACG